MGDDTYKENFVKCCICGYDLHKLDTTEGIDGLVHKDCAKREFTRENLKSVSFKDRGK